VHEEVAHHFKQLS